MNEVKPGTLYLVPTPIGNLATWCPTMNITKKKRAPKS